MHQNRVLGHWTTPHMGPLVTSEDHILQLQPYQGSLVDSTEFPSCPHNPQILSSTFLHFLENVLVLTCLTCSAIVVHRHFSVSPC